ncbi:MAG: helix-turn-helix domain-containing protein [Rhodomicrobium sp.]
MTIVQHKVLQFIKEYIAEHGYSPSHEEMAQALDMHTSTTSRVVSALAQRGYVEKVGRWRNIKLRPQAAA